MIVHEEVLYKLGDERGRAGDHQGWGEMRHVARGLHYPREGLVYGTTQFQDTL